MIIASMLLAMLISAMFIATAGAAIKEMRRENADGKLRERYNIL